MTKQRLVVATASAIFAASACMAAASTESVENQNYDQYATDVAAAARSATRPIDVDARLSAELTAGHPQHLDPLMNKATFVWAGINEPVIAVGPLEPEALIDAQARAFLRRQGPAMGLSSEAVDAAVLFEAQDLGRGPLIARYEQRFQGIEVFNRTLNVMLERSGRPVAVSGYFAADFDSTEVQARPFARSAAQAVDSAFAHMGGKLGAGALSLSETRDGYQYFSAAQPATGPLRLTRTPRAKKVYYPRLGSLEPGYFVELAAVDIEGGHSLMQSFVISAVSGDLLFRYDQIAYESNTYRVFADPAGAKQPFDAPLGNGYTPFPAASRSTIITRTGASTNLVTLDHGAISTGDPWLPAGATKTIGNHVDACIDSVDTPVSGIIVNPGNTCVEELGDKRAQKNGPNTFDYPVTADSDPSTSNARNAAIVNLFYIINWMHDWWYDHGFNEVTRNAQSNNYGRGGAQSDPLLAQGQDASGRNNANMGTPADGSSPTMQQYLFDGFIRGEVRVLTPVDSGPLLFSGAAFGPKTFNIAATQVVLANDLAGPSNTDGCGAPPPNATVPTPPAAPQATLNGKIALIDRGNCSFTTKAQFANASGAVGMIVINNTDGDPVTMGNGDVPVNAGASPSDPAYQIPSVMIRKVDGNTIKSQLPAVTAKMKREAAQDQDGTLDNQIIAHEYFHYVSNRLINNSSGLGNKQGGGMGEGWGDINGYMISVRADDRMASGNANFEGAYALAWYVTNNFWAGIRRAPYSTDFAKNAFTFKHIADGTPTPDGGPGTSNSEVHNTGEIWANMVWSCYAGILNIPGRSFDDAQSHMKDYLISGMKMTPASPTFGEARDGILASAFASNYQDFAACARGFARRGAGVYAVSPPRTATTNAPVTESYIALVARFPLVRVELIPDPDNFCDADSILDSGEGGTLELTFRNAGTFVPSGPVSATVSTTSPALTLAGGGQITLPALGIGESATVTLGVTAGSFAATPASVPLKIVFAPVAPGDAEVEPPSDLNTSFFANHDGGLRNFDDMEDATTSPVDWARTSTGAANWSLKTATATQGNSKTWFGNDPTTTAASQLLTPVFRVPAGGSFSMDFTHYFDFDAGFDGGVIEVQLDGGGWTDAITAGATFSKGNAYNDSTVVALGNRPGFTGTNTAKELMTLDFGTTLAGHDARLRFRFASDSSVGGNGWYIDDVKLNGIATPVFNYFAAEDGVCLQPVTISAGADFTAPEHPAGSASFSTVTLDGSATDPNSPKLPLQWQWHQVSGPAVGLINADTATPRFTAPSITADQVLEFETFVSSGRLLIGSDQVTVTIANVNLAPVANAGRDLVVSEKDVVHLNGSASSDPDGDTLTFLWEQAAGPAVVLDDPTSTSPQFTAPTLDADVTLTFKLTATDPAGAKHSDFVVVLVRDVLTPVGYSKILGGAFSVTGLAGLGAFALLGLRRRRRH